MFRIDGGVIVRDWPVVAQFIDSLSVVGHSTSVPAAGRSVDSSGAGRRHGTGDRGGDTVPSMPRREPARLAPPGASARGRWLPVAVLCASLLVFAVLAVACRVIYDEAEQSLLQERTDEASAVLGTSVSNIRAPLDAAATLASVTDGDPEYFAQALDEQVGGEGTFTSAALYRIGSGEQLASLGAPLELPAEGVVSIATLVETAASEPFMVIDLLDHERRLGYAVVDDAEQPEYVVYGERQLSTDPNVRRRTDEPFAELDYAIYLGPEESAEQLLGSSLRTLPIDGRRATATSAFGNEQLLLVMTPIGQLNSWLFANLWWMVALAGVLLSLIVAWLISRLYRRREQAVLLADENARLYDEQRHIAETLQLSLLPQQLEPPPGGDIAARYWPAGEASLIGGDFYDAFRVDERRWGVAIGDVCGKGIDAAAITGLVRHTMRAAARSETSPAAVLGTIHQALLDHQPSTFCTVCFLYIERGRRRSPDADGGVGWSPDVRCCGASAETSSRSASPGRCSASSSRFTPTSPSTSSRATRSCCTPMGSPTLRMTRPCRSRS